MTPVALYSWVGEVTAVVKEENISGQQEDMAKTANAEMTARYLSFLLHTQKLSMPDCIPRILT